MERFIDDKKDGELAIERLSHFRCGSCGHWWSIGDAPEEERLWHCPWCGARQHFKISKKHA